MHIIEIGNMPYLIFRGILCDARKIARGRNLIIAALNLSLL